MPNGDGVKLPAPVDWGTFGGAPASTSDEKNKAKLQAALHQWGLWGDAFDAVWKAIGKDYPVLDAASLAQLLDAQDRPTDRLVKYMVQPPKPNRLDNLIAQVERDRPVIGNARANQRITDLRKAFQGGKEVDEYAYNALMDNGGELLTRLFAEADATVEKAAKTRRQAEFKKTWDAAITAPIEAKLKEATDNGDTYLKVTLQKVQGQYKLGYAGVLQEYETWYGQQEESDTLPIDGPSRFMTLSWNAWLKPLGITGGGFMATMEEFDASMQSGLDAWARIAQAKAARVGAVRAWLDTARDRVNRMSQELSGLDDEARAQAKALLDSLDRTIGDKDFGLIAQYEAVADTVEPDAFLAAKVPGWLSLSLAGTPVEGAAVGGLTGVTQAINQGHNDRQAARTEAQGRLVTAMQAQIAAWDKMLAQDIGDDIKAKIGELRDFLDDPDTLTSYTASFMRNPTQDAGAFLTAQLASKRRELGMGVLVAAPGPAISPPAGPGGPQPSQAPGFVQPTPQEQAALAAGGEAAALARTAINARTAAMRKGELEKAAATQKAQEDKGLAIARRYAASSYLQARARQMALENPAAPIENIFMAVDKEEDERFGKFRETMGTVIEPRDQIALTQRQAEQIQRQLGFGVGPGTANVGQIVGQFNPQYEAALRELSRPTGEGGSIAVTAAQFREALLGEPVNVPGATPFSAQEVGKLRGAPSVVSQYLFDLQQRGLLGDGGFKTPDELAKAVAGFGPFAAATYGNLSNIYSRSAAKGALSDLQLQAAHIQFQKEEEQRRKREMKVPPRKVL